MTNETITIQEAPAATNDVARANISYKKADGRSLKFLLNLK